MTPSRQRSVSPPAPGRFTEFDRYVAFHLARAPEHINPNILGLPEVIGRLAANGVGAVFISGNDYEWGAEPVARGYLPTAGGDGVRPLRLETAACEFPFTRDGVVRAVRSRVATPEEMQELVPIVNDLAVRAVSRSKGRQAQLFTERMPVTRVVAAGEPLTDEALDALPTERIVIKADNAMCGDHSRIGVPKAEARSVLAELRSGLGDGLAAFVVQEMSPGMPMRTLRAYNPDEQVLIDSADSNGNHELRAYCFPDVSTGRLRLRLDVAYRIDAGRPGDRWVALDQDSVPPGVFHGAADITARLLDATGSRCALAGIDFFQDAAGQLRLREVNAGDPDLELEDPVLRSRHSRLLADQLIALAGRV